MITIRTCNNDQDIQTLADCAKDIWNEYFVDLISQDQINYMVDKFQSYPALSKAIKEEGYTYYLAFDENRLVGFCGIRIDQDRLFLSKLYLRKELRGQGISSQLFQKAVAFGKDHHLRAIYLTCNKYNENSLSIYKHLGFQTIDSVQSDIGHGFIMDDFILELSL